MATINASTKHTVTVAATTAKKKPSTTANQPSMTSKIGIGGGAAKGSSSTASVRRGAVAPLLKPGRSKNEIDQIITSVANQKDAATSIDRIKNIFRQVLGEHTTLQLNKPHSASTTRDRASAAADLATVTADPAIGVPYVLHTCGILNDLQRMLFPEGIESLLTRGLGLGGGSNNNNDDPTGMDATASNDGATNTTDDNNDNDNKNKNPKTATTSNAVIKPSVSALSLSSLLESASIASGTGGGGGGGGGGMNATEATIDSTKRGKTTPPNAREGCLLLLRALIEIVGKPIEPYVVGAFLAAALDECASSSSAVREAAEDACTAIISIANPYSFRPILAPILLQSLRCTEWRIKAAALERLAQCSTTASSQVYKYIPVLIPAVNSQVWDTKAQVSKAARTALLAICNTNTNSDIKPTIPALVNALGKPADTNKAVSELMGTTFVVPVDASVLSILCPLLARALKEKMALHKRAACIVINNMSKLVETPSAIAPFGNLLLPELQRVAKNVQFEEIRDEALKALASLTKALGNQYNSNSSSSNTPNTTTATPQRQHHHHHAPLDVITTHPHHPTVVETHSYNNNMDSNNMDNNNTFAEELLRENQLIEQEQERIRVEREKEAAKEAAMKAMEEEERKKFKDAMDAARELEKIQAAEHAKQRTMEEQKREKQKTSTRRLTGNCHACGLKRCKKTCMFYSG